MANKFDLHLWKVVFAAISQFHRITFLSVISVILDSSYASEFYVPFAHQMKLSPIPTCLCMNVTFRERERQLNCVVTAKSFQMTNVPSKKDDLKLNLPCSGDFHIEVRHNFQKIRT